MQYWKKIGIQVLWMSVVASTLIGCGGGSSSDTGSEARTSVNSVVAQENTSVVTETAVVESVFPQDSDNSPLVTLKGTITYDRVLFGAFNYSGLDYDSIVTLPVRGVTVQAMTAGGQVVASTQTDMEGFYQLSVAPESSVKVRVVAELVGRGQASWDVEVKDNTRGNAVYVMEGSLVSVGADTQTRNLNAHSGWTGIRYGDTRAAAPFAILDSIFDALQLVVDAEPNLVLPPLDLYWSVDNIAMSGSVSEGNIGTSYYTSAGPSIYLLGAANNDSDEYDRAVIQHEFGHYIEHQLARTESLGGSHGQTSKLDMRVAFGEGWGNAFSGMAGNDPLYRDSLGSNQSLAFSFDVEARARTNGWFSEATMQALLYDVFDSNSDFGDELDLGFGAIYRVLTSDNYLDFEGVASVYPFIAELKRQNPAQAEAITALAESYGIYGEGMWGENETNNGGSDITLPLYQNLSEGNTKNVCSNNGDLAYNGMEVRRLVRIEVNHTGQYDFRASRNGGVLSRTNPQMKLLHKGYEVASALSGNSDSDSFTATLTPGNYVLEVYEQANADQYTSAGGVACFNVRFTQI